MSALMRCRNCAGFGWEPSVYQGRASCGHCRAIVYFQN
jgi:hypothetical protein